MTTTKSATATVLPSRISPWRSAGLWLTVLLLTYILFSSVRAATDPAAFAASFGLPLGDSGDSSFVLVYAVRALFLGILGLTLLVRRQYSSLATFILVATIMPIGDALLVIRNGAGPATIALHGSVGLILLLTWYLLQRWIGQAAVRQE